MQDIRAIGFSANAYAFPEHVASTTSGENTEPNLFKSLVDGMKHLSEEIAKQNADQQASLEGEGTIPVATFGSDYIDFRMAEHAAAENEIRISQIRSVKEGLANAGYTGSGPFVSQTEDTTDTDYVVGENGDIWIKNASGESFLTSSGDDATLITRDATGGITGMAAGFSFAARNGVYQFEMNGSTLSFALQADSTGVSVFDSNGDLKASLNNDADVERFGYLHELFINGRISEGDLFDMFNNTQLSLDALKRRFLGGPESNTDDPLLITMGDNGENPQIQTTGDDGVVTVYDFTSGDFGIGGLGEGCTVLHADGTVTLGRSFETALRESYYQHTHQTELPEEVRNMIDDAVQFAQYVIGCAESADVAAIPGLVALLGQYSSALASIQPRVLEVDCAAATVGAACDKVYYKHGALLQVYSTTGSSQNGVVGLSTEQLQDLVRTSDDQDFSPTPANFAQQSYVA